MCFRKWENCKKSCANFFYINNEKRKHLNNQTHEKHLHHSYKHTCDMHEHTHTCTFTNAHTPTPHACMRAYTPSHLHTRNHCFFRNLKFHANAIIRQMIAFAWNLKLRKKKTVVLCVYLAPPVEHSCRERTTPPVFAQSSINSTFSRM